MDWQLFGLQLVCRLQAVRALRAAEGDRALGEWRPSEGLVRVSSISPSFSRLSSLALYFVSATPRLRWSSSRTP